MIQSNLTAIHLKIGLADPHPEDTSEHVWLLPIKLSGVMLPAAPIPHKYLITWRVSLLITYLDITPISHIFRHQTTSKSH